MVLEVRRETSGTDGFQLVHSLVPALVLPVSRAYVPPAKRTYRVRGSVVGAVVTEYDARSLTSSLPQLTDSRKAAKVVYDAVAGYGPLQRHLDDPQVEEIWINGRLTAGWVADPER